MERRLNKNSAAAKTANICKHTYQAMNANDKIFVTQPIVSRQWKELKALTTTCGRTIVFPYPAQDSWR